jgi:hypothetical protein
MLTKEAFAKYILEQHQLQAAEYGLSLEEYQYAVLNGKVVEAELPHIPESKVLDNIVDKLITKNSQKSDLNDEN